MSVNRYDTKPWLLLNSLLDCLVQLNEKNVQISRFALDFQALVVYVKWLIHIYNYDIYLVYLLLYYVILANLTEQAKGNVS